MSESASFRDVLLAALGLGQVEQQFLVGRVWDVLLSAWIFPGPRPTPPMVFARIRYARTGLRQWVIAPGLERR